jgi:hypothetical protein
VVVASCGCRWQSESALSQPRHKYANMSAHARKKMGISARGEIMHRGLRCSAKKNNNTEACIHTNKDKRGRRENMRARLPDV